MKTIELSPELFTEISTLFLFDKMNEEAVSAWLSETKGIPLAQASVIAVFSVRCMIGAIECGSGKNPKRVSRALAKEFEVDNAFVADLLNVAEDALQRDSHRRMILNSVDKICQEQGVARELVIFGAGTAAEVMAMMDAGATAEQVRLKLDNQVNPASDTAAQSEMHEIFCRWLPVLHGARAQLLAGADFEAAGTSVGLNQAPAIIQLIYMQALARYA